MPSETGIGAPYRIQWEKEAQSDVRRLDRSVAMRLFDGIFRYAKSGNGDVKVLQGDLAGSLRLRLGDYRVVFELEADTMRISGVRHRSEAYR